MMRRAMSVTDKGQLSDARAELAAFTSEMKASGLATKSTGDRWRDLTARAKDLFSAASIVRVAFTKVKEAVSTTIGLDKVYTDLIKVQSELTRDDYTDYLERCNRKAQSYRMSARCQHPIPQRRSFLACRHMIWLTGIRMLLIRRAH